MVKGLWGKNCVVIVFVLLFFLKVGAVSYNLQCWNVGCL